MAGEAEWKIPIFKAWVGDLAFRCEPGEAARALEKLEESLRYSDPVSSLALANVERDLESCIQQLEAALSDGDMQSIPELCRNALAVLFQRNQLCKLNKGT